MGIFFYTLGILVLTAILLFFSYLDRVYRELGRASTGRIHQHLEAFESEVARGSTCSPAALLSHSVFSRASGSSLLQRSLHAP